MNWLFSKKHPADNQVVLGIDGGGTKTHAILANADGTKLKEVFGGPTNPASVGLASAVETLGKLLHDVLKNQPKPAVTILGLAGIDTPEDTRQFFLATAELRKVHGLDSFEVINDSLIALANGSTAENALVLIAGTGSICYGRTPKKEWRAGGMDYLLSDEGSGYWIGLEILREVVRSSDGRAKPNVFSDLVKEHFSIRAIDELKTAVYSPLLSKSEIAKVAMLWDTGIRAQDEFALNLLDKVVNELLQLVSAVARALSLEKAPFDLVLAGSIATHPSVEPLLRARLLSEFPQLSIIIPTTPPVYGALTLAQKKLKNQAKS